MKVAVTGGSGFLGSHIVRHFSAADISRHSGHDVLSLHDMGVLEDFDLVVHMAALLDKSPDSSEQVFMTNVEGTLNVIKAMRPGATLVFSSTKDVYGANANSFPEVPETCPTEFSGQSPLEWSKAIAERYLDYYANVRGVRLCIFRLSTICARPDRGTVPNFPFDFLEKINTGEPILLPPGPSPVRDFLHISDMNSAIESFHSSGLRRGTFNLGGGRMNTDTLRGFIQRLEEVTGLQAVVRESDSVPRPLQLRYVSDLTLVGHELGWEPTKNLDHIAFYLAGRETGTT
jgi:nucleoside-diphosphate-sugar epimerase